MKIRKGFVSNSSSSSFVIGLKQRPKTWEEMHMILFQTMDPKTLRPEWVDSNNNEFCASSIDVAKNIFNQINDQDIVPNSILSKICDPGRYPKFPFWEDIPEGKTIKKRMLERYAIEHPYCISPTNRLWKKTHAIDKRSRMKYDAKLKELRKTKWKKISPRFNGLKKFVIMTQTDGGRHSQILCILECCWNEIAKHVPNVKLTAH